MVQVVAASSSCMDGAYTRNIYMYPGNSPPILPLRLSSSVSALAAALGQLSDHLRVCSTSWSRTWARHGENMSDKNRRCHANSCMRQILSTPRPKTALCFDDAAHSAQGQLWDVVAPCEPIAGARVSLHINAITAMLGLDQHVRIFSFASALESRGAGADCGMGDWGAGSTLGK